MGLIDDPSKPPQQEGKAITMTTMIPPREEPVVWLMVIACKSGSVYVGHQPGQELSAHKLCLKGAETLHAGLVNALKEQQKGTIVQVPPGFTLPPPPEDLNRRPS